MRGPWCPLWWAPWLGSPAQGHWGPLSPQKWLWCPYRTPPWSCPLQFSWHSLLPWWAPSLLLSVRGLGIHHKPYLVVGSSRSRPLLPGSLGVGSPARQSLAPSLVMWALIWCFEPSTSHLLTSIELSSPLSLEPQEMGGICPEAMTGWEGCNTLLHPGNQFGGCFLLVGSSTVAFTVASSAEESTYGGWAFLSVVFSDCMVKDSSERATPLKMASSGKGT